MRPIFNPQARQQLTEATARGGPTLPTPPEVLYVPPMKAPFEGQGRRCNNCMMWVPRGPNRCSILGPGVRVTHVMVCGYHVPGAPMRGAWVDHPGGMQYIPSDLAGLISAPMNGTSCGNCAHFDRNSCKAVIDTQGRPARVESFGCCTRWRQ